MRYPKKRLLLLTILPVMLVLSSCSIFFDSASLSRKGTQALKQRQYALAEDYFHQAIHVLESAAGQAGVKKTTAKKIDKELAVAYSNLAKAKFDQGKYNEAEPLYEKAIATFENSSDGKNDFIASCLHALSTCYFLQGNLIEAEKFAIEELMVLKALPGHYAQSAATANNLSQIYQKLGDDEKAESYLRWALELCQRKNIKSEQADILNNYATFLQSRGQYREALAQAELALKLQSGAKQKYSSDRARTLLVLASLNKAILNFETSQNYYQQALSILESKHNANLNLLCDGLEQYANLLVAQRKYKEAEPVFQRCIKYAARIYGLEHPQYAEKLVSFALLYRKNDQLSEAEKLLKQALSIQNSSLGVESPLFLETLNRLAAVLSDEDKYKEADEFYAGIIPKLKEKIGGDHPYVADALDNWALFVEKTRGKNQADKLHADATRIRLKLARSLHPEQGPERE
ncbi:MAG: tetratricopeptide repeat protein [Candidatus Obscuribacterales bacterium]|nr:tetratricopeptide repeat protein [Candidatus Obscuribacterales bacterium]